MLATRAFRLTMSTARLILQPLAIAVALAFAVRASSVGFYSIPSISMDPTLRVGDTIVVTPYHGAERPERGEVIVFRSPASRDEMMVKRVIARPGDLIESRDGQLMIGGHALAEPYVIEQSRVVIPAQVIPSDCYYVMGDNRPNSSDSRLWGLVARDAVVGRARLVLWSGSIAQEANASPLTRPGPGRDRGFQLIRVIR